MESGLFTRMRCRRSDPGTAHTQSVYLLGSESSGPNAGPKILSGLLLLMQLQCNAKLAIDDAVKRG